MIVKDGDPHMVNVSMTRDEALILHNGLLALRLHTNSAIIQEGVDVEYLRGQLAAISDRMDGT